MSPPSHKNYAYGADKYRQRKSIIEQRDDWYSTLVCNVWYSESGIGGWARAHAVPSIRYVAQMCGQVNKYAQA